MSNFQPSPELTTFAAFVESENELWEEILGRGLQVERGRQALEGGWQSVKLLDGFSDPYSEIREALADAGF
jgi:hypothetical protein